MGCNCGGSVRKHNQQEPREFRRDQGASERRRVQSGPPRPLRQGGPGDPNGGYYAQPRLPGHNGPPAPER